MANPAPWTVISALVFAAAAANAQVVWNESSNGDLSGDMANPTPVTLALGSNLLIATSMAGDREYVRMTVPAGLFLAQLINDSWQSTDQIGFLAVQAGPTFTEPPTGTNVANLLGYSHF